ncbi:MAG: hypothetical protein RBR19_05560 [Sedimentisphaerales bacterium]|jgi:2'-5' RNA ligase|nr:hypothetical protein [Sedimentisphaerales bacterium]
MNRIAIDVALLPEARIARLAIEVNRKLVGGGKGIVLDESACLPHISLAMGCMERCQTDSIGKTLTAVARDCVLDELTITGIVTVLNAAGEPNSLFAVAKTRALQTLHERIMMAMEPYMSREVTADMIWGDDEPAPSTPAWVRDYREKAAFAAFFPHITIGYGTVAEPMTFPIRFVARQIALCHLGNHCTCREVLASAAMPFSGR